MLNLKEQAEVYKLGLLIGYFKIEDVILWADFVIENDENPNLVIIDVSLSGKKGINEVVSQLGNINGKIDINTPVKTILGLLYKDLVNENISVYEIARKLYVLSNNIPSDSLGDAKRFTLNTLEDYLALYGLKNVTIQIIELLKEYEIYADNFIKYILKRKTG